MATTTVRAPDGADAGTVELDEAVFGLEPHMAVMHQVVTAQLANRRAGTQSTKTRSEVSGGGAKPWRQKGTGRARQGSTRAPHWRGGGVALGPKPRSYDQRTPKKMVRLALLSALSDRAAEGKVAVVDRWGMETPSTRAASRLLHDLGLEGRVLVVMDDTEVVARKSFRNLPRVRTLAASQLNAYDVLVSDWVLFTRDTLPGGAQPTDRPVDAAVTPVTVATTAETSAAVDTSDTGADVPEQEIADEADDPLGTSADEAEVVVPEGSPLTSPSDAPEEA